MNPIIYIDGQLADHMGRVDLQTLVDRAAASAGRDIDLLTHGPSKFHGHRRLTGIAPKREVWASEEQN